MVMTETVLGKSPEGTVKMSCDNTARSDSFPGAKLPFSFSANSAYAAVSVYAMTACFRLLASAGWFGCLIASVRSYSGHIKMCALLNYYDPELLDLRY